MNAQKIQTIARGERPEKDNQQPNRNQGGSASKNVDPRASLIETTRKNNVS